MSKVTVVHSDNIKLAVFSILLAVFALSLGDAVIKSISLTLTLWQIYVIRSALALPILLLAMKIRGTAVPLMPRATGWVSLRNFYWDACGLPTMQRCQT